MSRISKLISLYDRSKSDFDLFTSETSDVDVEIKRERQPILMEADVTATSEERYRLFCHHCMTSLSILYLVSLRSSFLLL